MNTLNAKDILHERGLKATSTRVALLQKLQQHRSAMPYSTIQEQMHDCDRVTLYRTLESLKKQGIIHTAFQENNETYYAICGQKCDEHHHHHDHIHFKCIKCENVTCEKPEKLIQISLANVDIHKVSIHVEGVCQNCLKPKKIH
ncbi:Fur family transcriptional regulator [Portibacter marinus]|uniref:Fur family transcriptional regulator n=1 Tax=Portibacter marinus TaxID=2898660 RepID=UPI0038739696